MNTLRARMKPYIQPFERELAFHELRSLSNVEHDSIKTIDGVEPEFIITTNCTPSVLADRLAYWETVSMDTQVHVTTQALRESTVNLVRNGVALDTLAHQLPFTADKTIPLPNRRCLRYGTHGIHEYRGKFFPQLVRSLINISGAQIGGVVACIS
jgi:site-specific DNA-methyltransferase (cytosine-N4-specific)